MEAVSKMVFFNVQLESTDTVKTPKSPEGDFKAVPSREVCPITPGMEGE